MGLFSPAADGVGMNLILAGELGHSHPAVQFGQDFQLEFYGEVTAFASGR
jgi:hypothetical protein